MKTPRPAIVWFRDDLRLSDHPALHAAAKAQSPVVGIYVLDERAPGVRPLGGASRWWLAQSLRALQATLAERGASLVLRRGPAMSVIAGLACEIDAWAVYWNEIVQAPHQRVADQLAAALARSMSPRTISRRSPGRAEPDPQQGEPGPAGVHTVSGRRVQSLGDRPKPLPAPKKLTGISDIASDALEDWHLEPAKPDWAGGLRETWQPGEVSAQAQLKAFLANGVTGYSGDRDRPDRDGTSRLSPHLRFGEISPRQIWHAAKFAAAEHPRLSSDIDKFLSELGWREFCRHLLYDVPDLTTNNLQASFDAFPWKRDDESLRAWQRGQTGYPIVDAGMRELWHTGVMHNRVRMVVASFLVKHLLIDWREGEQWFWDTLVDADAGSNPANWQWVAGSGARCCAVFSRIQSDSCRARNSIRRRLCQALGTGVEAIA